MDEIIHETDIENFHRLVVNNVPGEWFPPTEIATAGVYYGCTTDVGLAGFPTVFTIKEVEVTHLRPSEEIKR